MNNKKIAVFSLFLKSTTLAICMLVVACHYFSQNDDILQLHVDIVQLDAFDQFGYTPLMLAALQGVSSEVARLIRAGVHLDTKSKNKDFTSQQIAGNTALMFAIYG